MRTFKTIAAALSSALMSAGRSIRAAPTATPTAVPPAIVAAAEPGEGASEAIGVSRSLMFVREDVPAAKDPDFDDSTWVDVALPHVFDAPYVVGGDSGGSTFHVGVGRHRRAFDGPEAWAGKGLEFVFEGSFQITDIWINSEYVTTHRGAFAGFGSDSSDYVTAGGNEISVSVENRWCQELALRASGHRGEKRRILLAPGKSTSVSFASCMKSVIAETATMIGPASGRESATSTPATCS